MDSIGPDSPERSESAGEARWQALLGRATLVAAVVVGAAWILATWLGSAHSGLAGLSYDSFRYLAGADSILSSGGYLMLGGEWSLHWPPGTSILYASVARLTGEPPERLILELGLACFIISCVAHYLTARLLLRSQLACVMVVVAGMLNSEILAWHVKLWSEPPMLALHLLSVHAMCRALVAQTPRYGWMVASAVLVGAAISCRWAALPFAVAVVLAPLAAWRDWSLAWRVPGLAVAASLAPIVAIASTKPEQPLQTWAYLGQVSGQPDLGAFSILVNQIVPIGDNKVSAALVVAIALATALALAPRAWASWRAERPAIPPRARALGFLALSVAGYLGLIAIAPLLNKNAVIVLRYLAPVLPLIFLLVAAPWRPMPWTHTRRFTAVISVAMALVISVQGLRNARNMTNALVRPREPSIVAVDVAVTALRDRLRSCPPGTPLLTNAGGIVWFAARRPTYVIGDEHQFRAETARQSGAMAVVATGPSLDPYLESGWKAAGPRTTVNEPPYWTLWGSCSGSHDAPN